MKYIKLILRNYNRFKLNNTREIIYTPESPIQLILGTNGCGKSSLVKELSSLPANMKQEYSDNGYKEVTIEDNNKLFICSSSYVGGKTTHSFTLDGKELNDSGIKSIQLLLAKRYFNITPEIHELLTGVTGFCNASVASRKKWFTRLSNVDYTYALSVFKTLSERHRDITGTIKQHSNKLIQEKNKSLDKETIIALKDDIKELNILTEKLMTSKRGVTPSDDIDLEALLSEQLKKLNALSDKMSYSIIYNVEETIVKLNTLISIESNNIKKLTEDILEEKTVLERRNKAFSTDTKDIEKAIQKLKEESKKIIENTVLSKNLIDNVTEYISLYTTYYDMVKVHLLNLPDATKATVFTREKYLSNECYLDKYKAIKEDSILKLEKNGKILLEQEHLKTCKNTECPKCDHKWVPGFNNKILERARTTNDNLTCVLEQAEKGITTHQEFINEYNEYLEVLSGIKSVINHSADLDFIWHTVITNKNIILDQKKIIQDLYDIKEEFPLWKKLLKINNTIKDLESDLTYYTSDSEHKEFDIITRIDNLEDKLSKTLTVKTKLEKELHSQNSKKKQKKQLEHWITEVSKTIRIIIKNRDFEIEEIRNYIVNELITLCKEKTHALEQELNDSDNHDSLVKFISDQVDELSKQEKVLKIAIVKLSPTTGLIGKNIVKFITTVMEEMSGIISQLWAYDLEIHSCKLNSDKDTLDLDYRFPLSVAGNNDVSDISKASSSMKEVIDLAFKIIVMKYLDMDNGVLYLDEFGSSFDDTHRNKAFEMLDGLSQSKFSQVFIISHYSESYGRFINTDISILSTDNLDMSAVREYNKVLKIT